MNDAGRRWMGGLCCLLLASPSGAQVEPYARLGNVMWKTPDPTVWAVTVDDGWVIFRGAVPAGEFATLRIPPGDEAATPFRAQFDRWVRRDLSDGTVTAAVETVEKTAQAGYPMLQSQVTTTERDGRSTHRLYLGLQPVGRFEMMAYAASSEALFNEWAPKAVELINTMRFVSVHGELIPEGGTLPVVAATAQVPAGDDQAEFKRRDITADGWLDGTETRGVEPYDTDGDKEVTWAEFQAGRAKERGGQPPVAPAPQPAADAPAPQPVPVQPAATQAAGPAPKAPGPRALPAGQQGYDGLYFWLQMLWFGGNTTLYHNHLVLRPNGQAFMGCPPGGLEAFDFDRLAQSDPKRAGYYSIAGGKIHFEPIEGKSEVMEFGQADTPPNLEFDGLFALKVGKFPPDFRFEGWYEAANWAGGAGTSVSSARSFKFLADGTFTFGAYGGVSTDVAGAQTESTNRGTYQVAGNTMTIRYADGRIEVVTTYPFPDKDELPPKRMNIDGAMFKRVE